VDLQKKADSSKTFQKWAYRQMAGRSIFLHL